MTTGRINQVCTVPLHLCERILETHLSHSHDYSNLSMKAKYELFASTRRNKKSTEPCNAAKRLSPNTYTKLHGRKQKPEAHETITTIF